MSHAKIIFLGDISLNGIYVDLFKKSINPFVNLSSLFSKSDLIVGNLECMVQGSQGENLLKKPRLTTTQETLEYLNTINVNLVSLAHNHVYDHLEDGFLKTSQFLKQNNIKFIGASLNKDKVSKYHIQDINNIKFGFLNYVTEDTNPSLPKNADVYLNIFNIDNVIEDMKYLKPKVNHLILLLHWGGKVEGGLYPDWNQPKIARKLIDAGADLIIGHHPHTIQPYETYKGKHIFYSLGNFCFSDFCFEGKNYIMHKRRKSVILPQFLFSKTNYSVKITYWLNHGEQFVPIPLYKFKMFIRNLFFLTHRNRAIWNLYFFIHRKINPVIFYFARNDSSLYQKIKKLNYDKIIRQIKK